MVSLTSILGRVLLKIGKELSDLIDPFSESFAEANLGTMYLICNETCPSDYEYIQVIFPIKYNLERGDFIEIKDPILFGSDNTCQLDSGLIVSKDIAEESGLNYRLYVLPRYLYQFYQMDILDPNNSRLLSLFKRNKR